MRFQIPQFIETEDKIVGPLSLRQFIYIAAAGGVSILFYFTLQAWLWLILSLPLIGGAIAFAFVKVNGRPFAQLVKSAVFFYWKPQRYVWQSQSASAAHTAGGKSETDRGSSLERIVSGAALKSAWQNVQVGSQASADKASRTLGRLKEQYEITKRITGERRAARRIDYG